MLDKLRGKFDYKIVQSSIRQWLRSMQNISKITEL
jgi:hypothetical protein